MRWVRAPLVVAALAALALPVGLPLGAWQGIAAAGAAGAPQGTTHVDVLYAGSLVTLMQTSVGPAFHRATGYSVTGVPGGSKELAAEIEGGVRPADVLVSASPVADKSLERPAGHGRVSWFLTFATSPLLLGYNPSSRFARTLRTKPWWKVVTEPGFLLGRTNPVTDPKGVLAVKALDAAAKRHHDAQLKALASTPTDVFPEQSMVGRLQAGQLDAGFFYAVEAAAAKIPTVALTGVRSRATYTVTVVAGAPHPAAAEAFVAYLVSAGAQKLLTKHGLTAVSPPVMAR